MFSHTCSLLKLAQHFSPPLDRHMLEDFGVSFYFLLSITASCFPFLAFNQNGSHFYCLTQRYQLSIANICVFTPKVLNQTRRLVKKTLLHFKITKTEGTSKLLLKKPCCQSSSLLTKMSSGARQVLKDLMGKEEVWYEDAGIFKLKVSVFLDDFFVR